MFTLRHHHFFAGVILLCLALTCAPVTAEDAVFAVSSSPAGARVCIDTYTCGITPATFPVDTCTWHSVTISMEGYQTWSSTENTGSTGTTPVVADLEPEPASEGWLELDPSGADTYVDNVYLGNAAQAIPLVPGIHTLRLQKPGYYDYPEQFTITAGKTYRTSPVQKPYAPADGYGDIRVRSDPPGAVVRVNGNYMGTTYPDDPVYVTQLSPGTYTVTTSLPGYLSHEDSAVVRAGAISDMTVTLLPNAGELSPGPTGLILVRSIPAGGSVRLDGEFRGVTPTVLAGIAAGNHALVLRRTGYQDTLLTAMVDGKTPADVFANLTRSRGQITPTALPTKAGLSPLPALAGAGICALVMIKKKQ
jgi:hypothetical protein